MPVKIVTDSTSDLSPELAKEFNVGIVPVYVRFGEQSYRDGIDITMDEFYRRLVDATEHPTTSQPSPADFAQVYTNLAKDGDPVVSIHVSAKLSGTCNSAVQGKEIAGQKCDVTVIDSESVSMGLGMTALMAARMAKAGGSLQQITSAVKQAIDNTHLMGTFDTLKYLIMGGRIGKAKALVGSVLNVKPVLVMREGELHPSSNVRTHTKGVEKLVEFVTGKQRIEELTVIHTTTPDEAVGLRARLSSLVESSRLHIARLGPALGTYGGPGMLGVAIRNSPNGLETEPKNDNSLIDRLSKIHRPEIHLPKMHLPHR